MKIRHGFVTNSSSSSFILKGKEGERLTLEIFKSKLSDYLELLKSKCKEIQDYIEECQANSIPTLIYTDLDDPNGTDTAYFTYHTQSNVNPTAIQSFPQSDSRQQTNPKDEYYINLINEYNLRYVTQDMLELKYFLDYDEYNYEIREISQDYQNSLPKLTSVPDEYTQHDYKTMIKHLLYSAECPYIDARYSTYSKESLPTVCKDFSAIKNCDLNHPPCFYYNCKYAKLRDKLIELGDKPLTYEEYIKLYETYLTEPNKLSQAENLADIYISHDRSCHPIQHILPFLESIATIQYIQD